MFLKIDQRSLHSKRTLARNFFCVACIVSMLLLGNSNTFFFRKENGIKTSEICYDIYSLVSFRG
jgi:hypothetical protein